MEGLEELKKLLEECNQSHLLRYWSQLSEDQKKEFLEKLKNIDFKEAQRMWEKAHEDLDKSNQLSDDHLSPVDVQVENDTAPDLLEEYRNIGYEAISNNQVAVIVLAGGQGTRLGMPYPKGMCPTGIPSGKSLFQLQAERLRKLMELVKKKTGKEGTIYWYIMTSETTHAATTRFLEQYRYFDLKKDNIRLFKQTQIPCFNFEGKILLEEKDGVAMTPDGNGGIYKALKDNEIFEDMDKKGIKYVHVHSVDNILIKVADPVFIGKCIKDNIDCGLKVIKKTDPEEPLGIVVKVKDQVQVVEYSQIPENTASLLKSTKTAEEGLFFNAGNICNHFFTTDFLKKVSTEHADDMTLHIAKKTVTQIGPDGDKIWSPTPNCIKIEKFIFDVIGFSQNCLVWQIERSQEFSPIKNSDDTNKDCFFTAAKDLMALHKTWVEKVGSECQGLGVEVSPLLSYAGEGLSHLSGKTYEEEDELRAENEEDHFSSDSWD
ncbi:unnamed protein product [Ceutorhynchus assimilis]|uniref:UDP-N-acetylglucosamine diphosphorylase n=1 Tax=Ceutorhynchus assimilis TaxID=467358 RepID=A0A9N9MWY5_9CUCU|nr:unnamed protein product [Ceutorhynchus assimilis]